VQRLFIHIIKPAQCKQNDHLANTSIESITCFLSLLAIWNENFLFDQVQESVNLKEAIEAHLATADKITEL